MRAIDVEILERRKKTREKYKDRNLARKRAFDELHKNDKEVYVKISSRPTTHVCKYVPKNAKPRKKTSKLSQCVVCEFWDKSKKCPKQCPTID